MISKPIVQGINWWKFRIWNWVMENYQSGNVLARIGKRFKQVFKQGLSKGLGNGLVKGLGKGLGKGTGKDLGKCSSKDLRDTRHFGLKYFCGIYYACMKCHISSLDPRIFDILLNYYCSYLVNLSHYYILGSMCI